MRMILIHVSRALQYLTDRELETHVNYGRDHEYEIENNEE